MKRVENITIDVKNKEYDEITLKQMDTTQLVFKILNNSQEINLEGCKADVIFTKPNKVTLFQNASITEKKIVVDLAEECLYNYGQAKIEVEITQNNEVLSSFQLNANIKKSSKEALILDDTIRDQKIKENAKKNEEQDTRLEEIEKRQSDAESDIEGLQNKNSSQDREISENAKKIEENTNSIENLQEELDKLRADDNSRPSKKATGSYIHLTDSAEHRLKSFSIEGESYQEVSHQGKNILDLTKLTTASLEKVKATNKLANEITLESSVTPQSNIQQLGRYTINLKAGKYYIKCKFEGLNGTNLTKNTQVSICKTDWSNNSLFDATGNGKMTYTAQQDGEYYLNFVIVGQAETEVEAQMRKVRFYDIMISTEDVDYEPFVPEKPSLKYKSDVRSCENNISFTFSNKNLFNLKDVVYFNNITVDENDYLSMTLDNLNGSQTLFRQMFTSPSKQLKPNTTYYAVAEIKEVSGTGLLRLTSDETSSQISTLNDFNISDLKSGDIKIVPFVTKENFDRATNFLGSYLRCTTGQSGSIKLRISVLEDLVIAKNFEYVKREEQSCIIPLQKPFRKIRNRDNTIYRDKFLKQNNEWYEQHFIKEFVVDGSYVPTVSGVNTGETIPVDIYKGTNCVSYCSGYATHFSDNLYGNFYSTALNKVGYNFEADMIRIRVLKSEYPDTTAIQNMIKEQYNNGTPLKFYGILKEPELIKCTEEQVAVLDKIENELKTYKGVTNICFTDEIVPYNEIEYIVDEQIEIDNLQSQIDELKELLSTSRTSAMLLDNLQIDLESEVFKNDIQSNSN